mmetsp:Transcript_56936/g.113128  ORF Transcript_56936/g.113128 Transcript_56936/m.113128 type:complete len:209 (+) Transcript_56936:76-702(+)
MCPSNRRGRTSADDGGTALHLILWRFGCCCLLLLLCRLLEDEDRVRVLLLLGNLQRSLLLVALCGDRGARLQQSLDGVLVATACAPVQRRRAAIGLRLERRAGLDECANHLIVALHCCKMERSSLLRAARLTDAGPTFQQHFNSLNVGNLGCRGRMQRRHLRLCLCVDCCSSLHERLDCCFAPSTCSPMQRRLFVTPERRRYLCTSFD